MNDLPIGKQVSLPGHFDVPVILEAARPLGKGFECRVRLPDGSLDEAVITAEESALLAGTAGPTESKATTVNAEQLRLLVESARIQLAYAHDKHFAVSLSGIRATQIAEFGMQRSAVKADSGLKNTCFQPLQSLRSQVERCAEPGAHHQFSSARREGSEP